MSKDRLLTMGELKRAKRVLIDHQIKERKSNLMLGLSEPSIKDEGRTAAHDPISKLPDEILAMILNPLPLREAARTSILSKRWRHVWSSALKLDLTLRT
ncbi:hypothetical protein RND81_14G117900 [Saponaria officinalis]|uniref:F-box domain-containing protein n=1 Tax=Saponaria officinalis TaxID=3572 RepID=A0AAW1GPR2_SAPOF